jgi:hypothetical protein
MKTTLAILVAMLLGIGLGIGIANLRLRTAVWTPSPGERGVDAAPTSAAPAHAKPAAKR